MPVARCVLLVLLLAAEVCAASRTLIVRGQVSHARMWTKVRLYAVDTTGVRPLITLSDRKGRFSFDSVPEGTYTLYVNVRGIGCASRTVVVRRSLADEAGTITTDLPVSYFNRLAELRQHDYVISVQQLTADPYQPPREFSVAQQDLTNGELTKAQALLEGIVADAPKFVPAWDELAYAAVVSGKYAQAEADYRKALAAEPNDFTALLGMGRTLLEQDRLADALGYHLRAVAERPSNAVAQARLGLNYFELGNLEAAEKRLLSTERLDPANYTRPQLLLAEIYFRESDDAAALGQLADYVKRFPGEEETANAIRSRAKASRQLLPESKTLMAGK
jgi:tetratricopeptide (TPR) repeat protein